MRAAEPNFFRTLSIAESRAAVSGPANPGPSKGNSSCSAPSRSRLETATPINVMPLSAIIGIASSSSTIETLSNSAVSAVDRRSV